MQELNPREVHITDGFWAPRLEANAWTAIDHQWQQLERVGTIHNFRLVAGLAGGLRQGWFFADSDAYKWLDAACRVYALQPSVALGERIESFVDLIGAAQEDDGYLYTYNQFHFPGDRWRNLQIEHELYCHGHLIEAAVSHHEATGGGRLLATGRKAADLLVATFLAAVPEGTPGHQEIELALIKLYRVTGEERYLDLARHFLEQRGRVRPFAPLIFGQNMSVNRRANTVERVRAAYKREGETGLTFERGARNESRKPRGITARFFLSALSGQYFQQHRPVREQAVPVGHAVRFAYLETALAMLLRERGDGSLLPAMEQAWEHMVARRMYVTGGIGSLPVIEGFGRDYELDPEIAYAETCAALGCIFWNWEMGLITGEARYPDLLEWQLYNAAGVGMGLDGRSYLYNNPLSCRGGVSRQPWYDVACCPSNLSRTWAYLGRYLYSHSGDGLWFHQYVGSRAEVDLGLPVQVDINSGLPWRGEVTIRVEPPSPAILTLHLRVPSWAGGYRLAVNGKAFEFLPSPVASGALEPTASGCDPRAAYYLPVRRTWSPGDVIELEFGMPLAIRRSHPRVKGVQGRVALSRGPLVYCLESVDNPGVDIFATRLDLDSLQTTRPLQTTGPRRFSATSEVSLASATSEASVGSESSGFQSVPGFEDVWVLRGRTLDGRPVTAIPYAYWANRGDSQMTVMVCE
jgi:DUF1680 family protein